VQSTIIPGPLETIAVFFRLLQGDLLLHIGVSLYRIFLAMLISVLIGAPLGLWIGLNATADRFLSPIVYILYPIPKIAFLPVFLVLFGLGDRSKIILIITIIFFQILLAARDGTKEITKELLDSARSLGLNQSQIYGNLILPAVLPKMISALRISIGISLSTLFFAENYATHYGIGYFIMNSWIMVDYVGMFAGIMAISILGIAIFQLIDLMEQKLCPWLYI
jgi:NitT/TauT family transport system permease protein